MIVRLGERVEHLSAIKLKRTDTTLDLSQNGKGSWGEKRENRRGDDGVYIVFGEIEECRVGGVKFFEFVEESFLRQCQATMSLPIIIASGITPIHAPLELFADDILQLQMSMPSMQCPHHPQSLSQSP